jgi:hypothetical protein
MTSSNPGDPQYPYGQQAASAPPPWQTPPAHGYPTPPPNYPAPPTYAGYPPQPMPQGGYLPMYGYLVPPAPVPGGRLASMGARFGGLVVDSVLVGIPTLVAGAFTGAFQSTNSCDAYGDCTSGGAFHLNAVATVVGLVVGVLYSALLVGLRGQTLGHRVAGIKVVDANTGLFIGPGRAGLRWFVMIVTGAIFTLGYWSPFFDSQRRQGWHDKSSGSVAIPAR